VKAKQIEQSNPIVRLIKLILLSFNPGSTKLKEDVEHQYANTNNNNF